MGLCPGKFQAGNLPLASPSSIMDSAGLSSRAVWLCLAHWGSLSKVGSCNLQQGFVYKQDPTTQIADFAL